MNDKSKISANDIAASTRLLHEELSPDQEAMCRYSFKYAGRHVMPTYEQWENGFLTERDPDTELKFWMTISIYIKRCQIDDESKSKPLISQWCAGRCHPQLLARIQRFAQPCVPRNTDRQQGTR